MKSAVSGAIALATALASTPSVAAQARRETFGALSDGTRVEAVVLANGRGVRARIIAWGATLQSLELPDREGRSADVLLSYPDMTGYQADPQFFGATVGRVANRIAQASFVLDGKRYDVARNDGANALHGGVRGFDKRLWSVSEVKDGPVASVTLTRTSPDGEEGYPGALKASVTYALDEENRLTVAFAATTDKPTVVNMSNHSEFNLAGAATGRTVYDQRLTIAASRYTPVDKGLIPTGELRAVAATPFDFRTPRAIGARIADGSDPQIVIGRGYDHNFVLDKGATAEPRFAVRLEDPGSGRVMEMWTTEPGVQIYSGNFFDATVMGVGRTLYRQGAGIALEPQHFPDSPNQPAFPSTRLDPGGRYRQVSVYRFSTSPR